MMRRSPKRCRRDRASATPGPEPLEPRRALSVAPGLVETGAQPTGALTGKIVYTSAGHGWQWSDALNRWATDRGNLLSVVEDFGNQDQLTPYVDHLFRAGATVVPMRPVGRQLNEVVVDNDSPDVTWSGTWSNSTTGARWYDEDYGAVADSVRYRFANVSTTGQTAVATFTPAIPAAGEYPVYAWASHGTNRTTQRYVVNHTGGRTEVRVDHRMVGNGWVYLGTYHFDAGKSAADGSVEIGNFSTAGGSVVIADAIRFGNGMGDLRWGASGIETGNVSGYPREDEGSIAWCWRGIGLSTSFTSPSAILGTDNVSAPIRMAEEMNADGTAYGTSVYVGFHSNATTGNPSTATGRGALGLVHSTSPTPNQSGLATRLGRQINVDMRALDGTFAHTWSTRTAYSLTGSYGEISNARAAGEFDATIIEVAFHDQTEDTALLRDPRVRDQIARSTYEGSLEHLIDFPGTTTAPADVTTPSVPVRVQAVSAASGEVTISWQPGLSSSNGVDGVYGSPATAFRVFGSSDGRGFDGGTVVAGGASRSVTLRGLDPTRPYFFRVVAENAGGQSDVTEVVAATPTGNARQVLVVDGFDRLDSSRNFKQAYAFGGTTTERVWSNFNNPRNGVVPVVAAIQAARPGVWVDAASNEAVAAGAVNLSNYRAVVWILGNESTAGRTFDAAEQSAVEAYVAAGGHLLVTGSEIGWDLDAQNNGRTFLRSSLGASYVADSAGTFSVSAAAGALFAGVAQFTFSDGAVFSSLDSQTAGVASADVLAASTGARAALSYVGGSGGVAAVEKPAAGGRGATIVFGFPFESIVQSATRTTLMDRVLGSFGVVPPITDVSVTVPSGSTTIESAARTGPIRIVKRGAGTLVIDAANTHSGGILVEQGTLTIRNTAAAGSGGLEARAGAAVRLETGAVAVPLAALVLDVQSRVDMGSGRFTVMSGGFDDVAVRQALIAGRAGGSWDGATGIGSRSAAVGSGRAVGYRASAGTLTIAWAALGDVNLDGQIDSTDVSLINTGGRFGQGPSSGAVWAEGDFNYSGGVNSTDISLLNGTGLYGTGSYVPTAPAGTSSATASVTTTSSPDTGAISTDVWAAYALSQESPTTRKKR
ncbi:MAG: autotransporter-associated beta strand repeat-containing protein [Planctomycetaceae bacterium]